MARETYGRDEASVRDYLQIIWRRRLTIVLVLAVVCAAALARSFTQTPLYEASADVLLIQSDRAVSLTSADPSGLREDPERFTVTQARLARVDEVLGAAARQGGGSMTASELRHSSSVTAASDSDFLRFTVTQTDPELATRLASAYARQFAAYRAKLDKAAITRALRHVGRQLDELRGEGQSGTDAFGQLLRTQQELSTLELLQNPRAFVAGTPSSATQVAPRPLRDGVIAAMLGLVLAMGLAYLLEALDMRVRSADELASRIGIPLLGSTLAVVKRAGAGGWLPTIHDPAGMQAEAYRMVRLNVEFANLRPQARLVMVTSALAGEGKTVTAANLAVSFARAGRNVLLVDLDLRRPRMHELFEVPAAPGITDVTLGRVDIDNAILRGVLRGPRDVRPARGGGDGSSNAGGNLDLLAVGSSVADPGTFVETDSLIQLLAHLNARYEVVLLDTPPLLSVGDALALGGIADAAIAVSATGRLRKSEAREFGHALGTIRAVKLGLVVTGAEARPSYTVHPEREEAVVGLRVPAAPGPVATGDRWGRPVSGDA